MDEKGRAEVYEPVASTVYMRNGNQWSFPDNIFEKISRGEFADCLPYLVDYVLETGKHALLGNSACMYIMNCAVDAVEAPTDPYTRDDLRYCFVELLGLLRPENVEGLHRKWYG